MASGSSLLGIGISALQAYQRSLNTTGHNIANASTPGYSRQRVNLTSAPPQFTGYGYVGTGVRTSSVQRFYDAFIGTQVQSYTSSSTEFATIHQYASQVDNVLADPDAGLSTAMQRFHNAVQDLANDPGSLAARQVLVSEGQGLVDRFHSLGNWLDDLDAQVNSELRASVTDINRLSASIADLNEKIVLAYGAGAGQPPNDLLDQRDVLIGQLSEEVGVTTLEQEDGAINVMIGTGQALVVGNTSNTLDTYKGPGVHAPQMISLHIGANGNVPITDQLSGGRIGGLLGFRERVLEPTANELGKTAIGLARFFNEQHEKGVDINGQLGRSFFSFPDPQWDSYPGVNSSLSVSWNDVGQITGANYKLQFDGGAWSMTRADTGESVAMTGSGTAADPFVADGLNIVVDPAAVAGDTFLVQPTRQGAMSLQALIDDPGLVSAAFPVLATESATNTGSGNITVSEIVDVSNPAFQTTPGSLSPPLMIRFTGPNTYDIYDNSNPSSPALLESVSGYDPALGADVFPTPGGLDYGYQVHLTGDPAAGDEFTLAYNSNGNGDNRNAIALGQVLTGKIMGNGSESLSDVYNSLVSDVGTTTRQTALAEKSHEQLLQRSMDARDAVSGVNLDEEAANLVRFQQAYQAAAQVIATANEMFDTLLGAVRR
ncbi:flagellar hook-associated protein FlgK [Thiolapillus brandeum]|uniref:Flagellar hook-associated protein 1 n=1 Tax=Thiolapillus brandeum TaxID=1076588 RepID=A0A7U6GIL1_9GAMM|nr:flagellar hook-associated protein FlgK [Thiolapillus brandeum]BAO44294.1 flagellar hook-associated protein 1 FlgK [Thiolapillus brandeum]